MGIEVWHIWVIVSIVLLIIEVFTSSFLAMCLAIGCLSSAFAAYFNFDIKVQLFAFSVGALIAFFTVRPLMLKYFHSKGNKIKTNANALVGKVGRVVETIDFEKNQGRVVVEGDNWRAETLNNETINAGEKIEVVDVNSTILIVKLFLNNI